MQNYNMIVDLCGLNTGWLESCLFSGPRIQKVLPEGSNSDNVF